MIPNYVAIYLTGLLADVFRRRSDLGNLVFIFSDPNQRKDENRFKKGVTSLHRGWPLINLVNTNNRSKTSSGWARHFLKKMHLDVFLFIDFRNDYLVAHNAMPNIPSRAHNAMPNIPSWVAWTGHATHAPRIKSRA